MVVLIFLCSFLSASHYEDLMWFQVQDNFKCKKHVSWGLQETGIAHKESPGMVGYIDKIMSQISVKKALFCGFVTGLIGVGFAYGKEPISKKISAWSFREDKESIAGSIAYYRQQAEQMLEAVPYSKQEIEQTLSSKPVLRKIKRTKKRKIKRC